MKLHSILIVEIVFFTLVNGYAITLEKTHGLVKKSIEYEEIDLSKGAVEAISDVDEFDDDFRP